MGIFPGPALLPIAPVPLEEHVGYWTGAMGLLTSGGPRALAQASSNSNRVEVFSYCESRDPGPELAAGAGFKALVSYSLTSA
jgi:hypothetical protein